jgi:Serine aminopeptidase, S33
MKRQLCTHLLRAEKEVVLCAELNPASQLAFVLLELELRASSCSSSRNQKLYSS